VITLKRNKFFCAKIERVFFKNSVKVGLGSTSNIGKGGKPNTRCTPPLLAF